MGAIVVLLMWKSEQLYCAGLKCVKRLNSVNSEVNFVLMRDDSVTLSYTLSHMAMCQQVDVCTGDSRCQFFSAKSSVIQNRNLLVYLQYTSCHLRCSSHFQKLLFYKSPTRHSDYMVTG